MANIHEQRDAEAKTLASFKGKVVKEVQNHGVIGVVEVHFECGSCLHLSTKDEISIMASEHTGVTKL